MQTSTSRTGQAGPARHAHVEREASSGRAFIAASARRPARPIFSRATNSIARADASTSSRTCWSIRSSPVSDDPCSSRRPLPLVSVLHDDLSFGGALHAPGRSCPSLISRRTTDAQRLEIDGHTPDRWAWSCRGPGCSGMALGLGAVGRPVPSAWRLGRSRLIRREGRSARGRAWSAVSARDAAPGAGAAGITVAEPMGTRTWPRIQSAGRAGCTRGAAHRLRPERCSIPPSTRPPSVVLTRHGIEVVVAARPGLLRRPQPPSGPARGGARSGEAQYRRRGSSSGPTPSSPTLPAAARSSRITVICCVR